MRPTPPAELSSLLPVSDVLQHWQQQQQATNTAAAAAEAEAAAAAQDADMPVEAVSSWLSSWRGLRALSDVLRPGSLLEYQDKGGDWVPVVVLHCSLTYMRQPEALQALLQEGFDTPPADAAAAEPGRGAVDLPGWQPLKPNKRLATLLLLNTGQEVREHLERTRLGLAVKVWG